MKPGLVVAMGATATHALTGVRARVNAMRGRVMPWKDDSRLLVTVHPAAILRASPAAQDVEYERFAKDICLARPFADGAHTDAGAVPLDLMRTSFMTLMLKKSPAASFVVGRGGPACYNRSRPRAVTTLQRRYARS